jgi:preprotein translocase subunit SecE
VSDLTKIIIVAVIVGAVFAYLWWQGQVRRFVVYCQLTWEELKKCSWPTWDELKGSTTVIVISIALLGGFTVVVDMVLNLVFHKMVY